jgi:hypothetical protein
MDRHAESVRDLEEKMSNFEIKPKVDETQEFIEIANDFSNPLEIVREALSNSFDAKATKTHILFSVENDEGESVLKIQLIDDGHGMTQDGLQAFFDLGNSTRRNDPSTIGEKGHGTKVYFNCKKIVVNTCREGKRFTATMNQPYKELQNRRIPIVQVTEEAVAADLNGTHITVFGYNNNRRDKFTHEILRDYIKWFTAFGSVETAFKTREVQPVLFLRGLGNSEEEKIDFGHHFPAESKSMSKLFDEYLVQAPDYYSRQITRMGILKNFPEIKYEAIFSIEGKKVRYGYNPMLRRQGYQAPNGSYTVQDRYGLWLAKDFIPIQRKNEWLAFKGQEFTRFHAFFNCQHFKLTANRGSVDNTPSEILSDIKDEVEKIYFSIVDGDEWRELNWLEDQSEAYQTTEKEKSDFKWRIERANKTNVAERDGRVYVEPRSEIGVYSLYLRIAENYQKLFPFYLVDYDTHQGVDVIAKGDNTTPIHNSKLYYIEFKYFLDKSFNHSFENLHSIICWDTQLKHNDTVRDINDEERKLLIVPPDGTDDYIRYFLDHPKRAHKIEIFVLKDYLKSKLSLDFRPRSGTAVL